MRKIFWGLIGADIILALISLLIGAFLCFGAVDEVPNLAYYGLIKVLPFVSIVIACGFFCEVYSKEHRSQGTELAARIAVELMAALLMLSLFYYIVPLAMIGRGYLSLTLGVYGIQQFVLRRGLLEFGRLPGFAQRVLILGVGPLAETMEQAMGLSRDNYVLAGFVQPENDVMTVPADLVVGRVEDIRELATRHRATELVVSLSERRGVLPVRELLKCKLSGINVLDAPCFYEKMAGKLLVEDIQPSWFIYSNGFRNTPFRRFFKRILDVACSLFGILVALPLFPLVALAVKLDSPGPALFKQKRVGERGREFFILKYRTMCQDAEKKTGAVWATENDPRITRIGGFLRKTRLDEIPQLFNVLRGDMSFVGPRPERQEFVSKLSETIPYYNKRHFIKPGVTGWAQICYPYGASEEDALEKLRYDLYYIKNYSILLDLSIILETVKTVIYGRGGR